MKKLLAATLMLFSSMVFAQELYAVFPDGEVVLTDKECTAFTAEQGGEPIEPKYAYAINLKTQEKVEGCYVAYQVPMGDKVLGVVEVHLVDPSGKKYYDFKIPAQRFQPRDET